MAKTIEQILSYVNLCGVIQATETGVPKLLPDAFWNTTRDVIADAGRFIQVTGTRTVAKQVMYDSPAVKVDLKNIAEKDVKLFHTFEQIQLTVNLYQKLLQYENYEVQNLGKEELARQLAEFRQRQDNLMISAVMSALVLGTISFDSNGNLLPSTSGASLTIDYGMAAGNQTQLNVDGSGSVISASWATTSTDIATQIVNLKEKARRLTGYPLRYAFYGRNIPGYFASNTIMQQFIRYNVPLNANYLQTGQVPSIQGLDILGLTWIPINESFYEDQNGSNQAFQGVDTVVFTPEIDRRWYEMLRGTFMVPNTFQPLTEFSMSSYKQVAGMFGYAVPNHNPPTADVFMGNTFLPVIKVPNAIFQADVTP